MSCRCLETILAMPARHRPDVVFCFLVQVAFYETMFLHRPGVLPRQKLLRANKSFRGKERRHHVLVEATGAPGEQWIAVLIMFAMCVYEGKKKKTTDKLFFVNKFAK